MLKFEVVGVADKPCLNPVEPIQLKKRETRELEEKVCLMWVLEMFLVRWCGRSGLERISWAYSHGEFPLPRGTRDPSDSTRRSEVLSQQRKIVAYC